MPFLNFGKSLQECCCFLLCGNTGRIGVPKVNNLLPPAYSCSAVERTRTSTKSLLQRIKKKYALLSSKLKRLHFFHDVEFYSYFFILTEPAFSVAGFNVEVKKVS